MAEQTPLDRWSSTIVMRRLSTIPESERPTGLRDMEESNHGYD
jgi:hypothetical protein